MIRIAMVEDEAAVREQLMGYVQRYTRQYGTEFSVTEFADGMDILENYRPVYDIVFLDVEMKHLDGMETARRIRALDADVVLIFITNMAQYAIKGYAVGRWIMCSSRCPTLRFPSSCKRLWKKSAAMPGIIWRSPWRAACGDWIQSKSIIWKVRATGCIFTPRMGNSRLRVP